MRATRLQRMLADDEAPAVPPQGHREIQDEELARLFGRMAQARVVAIPPLLGVALWIAWVEPASWRRAVVGLTVAALVAFFVAEWIRWRMHGFTPAAVPRNLSVGITGIALIAVATGGIASPFLFFSIPLGIISGVFVPWPTNLVLAAVQLATVWGLVGLGLGGIVPGLNLVSTGGGPALAAPAAWTLTHAAVLTFVYLFAATAGRAM